MHIPKIKLLIWPFILSLILGCVPVLATPTPVPPLDPNTINIFIAQTSEAASLQTAAAMPTFTPTATFTATPRNTFTPEPSVTPIQTFLIPSLTPVTRFQYYRVKHDNQLAMYNFKSRTWDGNSEGMLRQTPEVVPLFVAPKEGVGTDRTNVSSWENYIDALNNYDEKKINYLKSNITGLFNTAGFPQLESLTMGGNIVQLDEIRGDWGRVHTMDYAGPPSAVEVNYFTNPNLVHKFVVVGWRRSTKMTILVNPPKGDIYWPLVTKRPVWVPLDRLEPFPILPMEITANEDLYIQKTPGPKIEEARYSLFAGKSAKVIEYHLYGPDVWGRLEYGGWIPLLLNRKYYTSWSMATVPPP